MRLRALVILAASWLAPTIACSAEDAVGRRPLETPGAPIRGAMQVPSNIALPSVPTFLGEARGAIVVGMKEGVLRENVGDGSFAPMLVASDRGETSVVGNPLAIAARGPGDADGLVLSDRGLYQASSTTLIPSPISEAVVAAGAKTLSVTNQGPSETLWFTTRKGALVWHGNGLVPLSLVGTSEIERIAGIDDHLALLVAAEALWELDTHSRAIVRLAEGVGHPTSAARAENGTLHIGTTTGLWSRSPSGIIEHRTFAAGGMPPASVRSVATSFDSVVALVGDDVVSWDGATSPHVVGSVAGAIDLAVDAHGDTWTRSQGGLHAFRTGKPVSFERDVKPFVIAHCQSCHATGADGAPIRAFDRFDVAKSAASEIALRLRGANRPVMPPARAGTLRPADYRVVLRWQASGTPL
ncbi:MAG: hypothetical protein U0174_22055 [Polyangiaceae bacterium]